MAGKTLFYKVLLDSLDPKEITFLISFKNDVRITTADEKKNHADNRKILVLYNLMENLIVESGLLVP